MSPGTIGNILDVLDRLTGRLGGGSSGRGGATLPSRIDIYVHETGGTRTGSGRSSSRSTARDRSSGRRSTGTARDVDDDGEDMAPGAMAPGDDLEERVSRLEDRIDQMSQELRDGLDEIKRSINPRRTASTR
jgi:hypothetical protein